MWARPDGSRVLLVPSSLLGEFVTIVYGFEEVRVVPLEVDRTEREVEVRAGELELSMRAGSGWRIPLGSMRSPWLTRWVEAPVARLLLGVRAWGVSPTGVEEWYQADQYRRVVAASARLAGRDLGPMLPFVRPPARFGFGESPRRPSVVLVRPRLEDPSGRLDRLVSRQEGGPAPRSTRSVRR